ADLNSTNDARRVPRPAPARIYAGVEALPNARVVGAVSARTDSIVSGCRDCWYKRSNDHNQRNNAAAEGSHVRVLPHARASPAPDNELKHDRREDIVTAVRFGWLGPQPQRSPQARG